MRYSGSFGRWLKLHRKNLDLTQEEFAQQVGCAVTTIRRIEADVRRPSKQLAELLARHLHIPAEERADFIRFARNHTQDTAAERTAENQKPVGNVLPHSHERLPNVSTPLIGRAAEVTMMRDHLLQHEVRLLTLSGPPGVGKTRLASHIAIEMQHWFPDGVFFVALAPIRSPDLIPAAILQTLGIRQTDDQPLPELLTSWVGDRHLLLLLDNFEHLMAAASIVADLLAVAPNLKLVITSRMALHIPGEHEFTVPPLARPNPKALPPLVALARYPAIDLFVQRARASRPDFRLANINAADIAEICHHLDGLPLAIELAAARVKLLTPSALLTRLVGADHSSSLDMLTAGVPELSPQQHTLRSAIAWSYTLLQPHERKLLQQLAIFAGSFTLDAVEHVCDEQRPMRNDTYHASSLLDSLATLLDQSLLQQAIGADGEPRFSFLEVIREYAAEQLDQAGFYEAVGQRHALYYLAFVEEADPKLSGPQQAAWLERLETEYANLRAALGWALDRGEADTALRFCTALRRFWDMRGYLGEGRRWFDQALLGISMASVAVQAKALSAAATLAAEQGDYAQAIALHQQGLTLKEASGDVAGIASSLNNLVLVARAQGDFAQAQSYGAQSLALYRELADKQGVSRALNNLGLATCDLGDYARATALHQESLALKWELGDKEGIASSLNNLGLVARLQGDYERAHAFYEEGLAMCRTIGSRLGIAIFLNNLGSLARTQGQYQRAITLCEESLALRREFGDRRGMGSALQNLALATLGQKDFPRATVLGKESLSLAHDVGNKSGMAGCMIILAMIAGAQGRPLRAAHLYGAAEALNQAIGVQLPPSDRAEYERRVAEARIQADEALFADAWAAGRGLSIQQAITIALGGE